MNIKDFIKEFSARLSCLGWYDSREIKTMAMYLLKEVASVEQYKIIVSPDMELKPDAAACLMKITEQMASGCPMQYALGYEYFCGHKFKVKEGVLIPRPETEELVKHVIDGVSEMAEKSSCSDAAASDETPFKLLDICTGSGCIALSLASALPQCRVWGCDISDRALDIARSQEIEGVFFKCDILGSDALKKIAEVVFADNGAADGLDIIVSNPPYVCEQERGQMRPNVLDFEPELALFVPDDDPLLFYRRIAELSGQLLKDGGKLYFEVNERFANEVAENMECCGFVECRVAKDMFGKERMVVGVLTK